ncbi:MAG: hypothetical protein KC643_17510, partial [Nitrospira sp.]|nr:hypothetical protein [Nitrospira sp.]
MMSSFFEVDVCSLTKAGEQTQPDRKKGGRREKGKGRAAGTGLHRITRDRASFPLARPVRDR